MYTGIDRKRRRNKLGLFYHLRHQQKKTYHLWQDERRDNINGHVCP